MINLKPFTIKTLRWFVMYKAHRAYQGLVGEWAHATTKPDGTPFPNRQAFLMKLDKDGSIAVNQLKRKGKVTVEV